MNIYQLEYFVQLAKYEHMSETADFLNISQSALSKSISALESELSMPLFDRVGRRMKLNAAGAEFAKHVTKILAELDSAVGDLKKIQYEQTGTIGIQCYAHYGIVAELVGEYQRLNPQVRFAIPAQAEGGALEDIDFIICSSGMESSFGSMKQYWVAQPVFDEGFVVAAAPELLPEGADDKIDLSVLKDTPFLGMAFGQHVFLRDSTYAMCQNAGFQPQIHAFCNDFILKTRLAEAGSGVMIIPECCVRDVSLLAPSLRFLHIRGGMERSIFFLRKKKNAMSEAALDFWNFILQHYDVEEVQDE